MIKLILYGANDKPVKTLVRSTVRWNVLKRATNLQNDLRTSKDPAEILDTLCELVADCFEGDATFDEIEKGAQVPDMLRVVAEITTTAIELRKANFQTGAANK